MTQQRHFGCNQGLPSIWHLLSALLKMDFSTISTLAMYFCCLTLQIKFCDSDIYIQPWNKDYPNIASRPPPFLSHEKEYERQCSPEQRTTLGLTDDPIITIQQPTPENEAFGEIHVSAHYDKQFNSVGIQIVSFDGFPLGKCPTPFPSHTTSEHCPVDEALVPQPVSKFKGAVVPVTGQEPEVVHLAIRILISDFHSLSVYYKTEEGQIKKGFQVQLREQNITLVDDRVFVSPANAGCYIFVGGPIYNVLNPIPHDWPMKRKPSTKYNCHGGSLPVERNITNALHFNPDYMKEIEKIPKIKDQIGYLGDYCPRQELYTKYDQIGPVSQRTQDLVGNFIDYKVYSLTPHVNGWFHIMLSATNGNTKEQFRFNKMLLRVVSKSGVIVGEFLRPSKVPCTDSSFPSIDPTYTFYKTPSQGGTINPTTMEIEFADYTDKMSIFWSYKASESIEMEHGFQIQAHFLTLFHGSATRPYKETAKNFVRQFSGIYSAPRFSQDVVPEDTTDNQGCQRVHVNPTSSLAMTFLLDYDFKRKCEEDGLQHGNEAQNLWPGGSKPIITPPALPPPLPPGQSPQPPPPKPLPIIVPSPPNPSNGSRRDPENEAEKIESERKKFYISCGKTKVCVGWKKMGCIKTKSCDIAVGFRKASDNSGCIIEVLGRTQKYIAMGLSRDRQMGGDAVVECVREGDSKISVYLSYNNKSAKASNPSRENFRIRNQPKTISLMKAWFEEDIMYCEFKLYPKIKVDNDTFNLRTTKFYILSAHGDRATDGLKNGHIDQHGRGAYASDKKYKLMDQFGKTDQQILAEKIHIIMSFIAWTFLIPISTFMSRYFKETFIKKYICHLAIWFAAHTFLIVIGIICIIVPIIFLMSVEKGNIGEANEARKSLLHNIAGFILTVLLLIQFIAGIYIAATATKKKGHRNHKIRLLRVTHAFFGHVAFFYAYTLMYTSKDMYSGLPCDASGVLIGWIVAYFVIHLLMSYQVCYQDFVHGLHISRVYKAPNLRITKIVGEEEEAPGGLARKILLAIFIVICAAITGILIAMFMLEMKDCSEEDPDEV